MVIFTTFFITAALFFLSSKDKNISKTRCIIYGGVFLFLIAAMRDTTMGIDTLNYLNLYHEVSEMSFKDILQTFPRETPFYIFVYLSQKYIGSYQFILAVVAALYTISICYFINKYSKNAYLSFVILLSLGFFSFSITGMRQTIAMSIVMFSMKYVYEKKFLKFLILVLIAATFHNSAILFIIAYFVTNIKVDMRHIVAVILCVLVSIYISLFLPDLFTIILRPEASLTDSVAKLNWTGFMIQFAVMAFSMLYYEHAVLDDPKNLTMYNYMFVGLCFQAFAVNYAEMFRLSMYFSIFNVALIPNVITNIRRSKERQSVQVLMVMGFLAYFYYTLMDSTMKDFLFFWQTK